MIYSRKALEEIANRHDEIIESGRELEGLVRVNARVSKSPGSVHSTRYSHDEITLIYKAAERLGTTTSAFIRAAALAAASGELDLLAAENASKWAELRKIARELTEAIELQSDGWADDEKKPAKRRKKAS